MKINLKNLILCAIAALGLSAAGSASAGSILQFGGSTLLVPGFPSTAKVLTDFRAADGALHKLSVVDGSTGSFAAFPIGTKIEAGSAFTFAPAASAVDPLFSFDSYHFDLDESTVTVFQGGSGPDQFLNIFGQGIIFGPSGYIEPANFTLSAVGVSHAGRISLQGNLSTVSAPEAGSSALLLCLGMFGLAFHRPSPKNRS